jgi:predicted NAD-dependent protein-ADP-ribosyltransferase YbiA (DUF1768 family)
MSKRKAEEEPKVPIEHKNKKQKTSDEDEAENLLDQSEVQKSEPADPAAAGGIIIKKKTPEKFIYYHSKTKGIDDTPRYLSNFAPCKITYKGKTYPSVEHAYQAQKFTCLQGVLAPPEKMISRFTVSGDLGKQDARVAKSAGGKGAMKKFHYTLDAKKWEDEKTRVTVMTELVKLRLEADKRFKDIITEAVKDGVVLLHFERPPRQRKGEAPKVPFWGMYFPSEDDREMWVGDNTMGEILMKSVC